MLLWVEAVKIRNMEKGSCFLDNRETMHKGDKYEWAMQINGWDDPEMNYNDYYRGHHYRPVYTWDCSFKLDFDGPILSLSTRFYGPNKNGKGTGWEGDVCIVSEEDDIIRIPVQGATLNEVTKEAEAIYQEYKKRTLYAIRMDPAQQKLVPYYWKYIAIGAIVVFVISHMF